MSSYQVKDKKALAMGTKIEMEHHMGRKQARKIATDHLREHPSYYEFLPIAEQQMTIEERSRNIHPIKRRRNPPPSQMPQGWYGFGK